MSLEIRGLNKKYNDLSLFNEFDISFTEGTITCILGPSGCGKTTLLNIIGNITRPDSGILSGFSEKRISYVFQDPRLLPWKNVEDNIGFVLDEQMTVNKRKKITDHLIKLMDLEEFAGYYPSKLSGGMRQRVSIARAFAYPSDIILMDEPLKGLDIKLKQNLMRSFSRIWQSDRRTVIFVTHDVDEAMLIGNDIIVMSRPPARVILNEKISIPFEKRSPDHAEIRELKTSLLTALGG